MLSTECNWVLIEHYCQLSVSSTGLLSRLLSVECNTGLHIECYRQFCILCIHNTGFVSWTQPSIECNQHWSQDSWIQISRCPGVQCYLYSIKSSVRYTSSLLLELNRWLCSIYRSPVIQIIWQLHVHDSQVQCNLLVPITQVHCFLNWAAIVVYIVDQQFNTHGSVVWNPCAICWEMWLSSYAKSTTQ